MSVHRNFLNKIMVYSRPSFSFTSSITLLTPHQHQRGSSSSYNKCMVSWSSVLPSGLTVIYSWLFGMPFDLNEMSKISWKIFSLKYSQQPKHACFLRLTSIKMTIPKLFCHVWLWNTFRSFRWINQDYRS